MKSIKRIAAFVLVICFCFVLMISPGANAEYAITGQQFGAWIASALVSLNCIGQILGGDFQTGIDAFHQLQRNIGVPTIQEIAGQLPQPYDVYTFDDAAVSDALNTSTIRIRQGVTTIDGVEYDELWVSPEGAQKLKTNAFDFITKYNLLTNDTSTLMTGWGQIAGVPVFKDSNNGLKGQIYTITPPGSYSMGDIKINFYDESGGRYHFYDWALNGSTIESHKQITTSYPPNAMQVTGTAYGTNVINKIFQVGKYNNAWQSFVFQKSLNADASYSPFEYNFINGTIPAPETIPNDYGLAVRIPHEQLENFYNVYPQYNYDNSVINIQQDQIDINELTNAIFDYVESMQDIKSVWTNGEEPEPPVPVDPIENIDQNVSDITQYQQDMQQQVNHMHQDVEDIHQTQQQQQQTQQLMQQDTSSIDSTLKDVTATPGQSDLPSFKFDLRELFPFCIPFDIYRLLSSFDATPTAPHVRLPIVIQSIGFSYTLDLDFSSWDPVAQAMRTAELIVYAIGLAWATGKVIKW